eukprot:9206838-Pyramimonas_sp.AAC.1
MEHVQKVWDIRVERYTAQGGLQMQEMLVEGEAPQEQVRRQERSGGAHGRLVGIAVRGDAAAPGHPARHGPCAAE